MYCVGLSKSHKKENLLYLKVRFCELCVWIKFSIIKGGSKDYSCILLTFVLGLNQNDCIIGGDFKIDWKKD